MGRGKNWSPDDDAKLLRLLGDNPGELFVSIARKAIAYEMFEGRSESAIASRISYLKGKNDTAEGAQLSIEYKQPEEESIARPENTIKALKQRVCYLESIQEKYNKLVQALLLNCDRLGIGKNGPYVYFDYQKVSKILWYLERDMFQERIAEQIEAD